MTAIPSLAEFLRQRWGLAEELVMSLKFAGAHLITLPQYPENPDPNIHIGPYDPDTPQGQRQYVTRRSQFLERADRGGFHETNIRNSSIVVTFEHWEHVARPQIAAELGIEKNDVRSDVFGDLRHYRNACAHSDPRLYGQPKELRYFSKGDRVSFDYEKFDDLFSRLVIECNNIASIYGISTGTFFSLR